MQSSTSGMQNSRFNEYIDSTNTFTSSTNAFNNDTNISHNTPGTRRETDGNHLTFTGRYQHLQRQQSQQHQQQQQPPVLSLDPQSHQPYGAYYHHHHQQQYQSSALTSSSLPPIEEDDEFGRIIMEDANELNARGVGGNSSSSSSGGGRRNVSASNVPIPLMESSEGSSSVPSQPMAMQPQQMMQQQIQSQRQDQDHDQDQEKDLPRGEKKKRKRKPPSVPWKKPKDMPRRPLSAYNLYFKKRREELMKEEKERQRQADLAEAAASAASSSTMGGGTSSLAATRPSTTTKRKKPSNKSVGIGFANLAKTIAAEWKELSDESRAPYEELALPEKERYDAAMIIWRAKQKEEKAAAAAAAKAASRGKSNTSPKRKSPTTDDSPSAMDVDTEKESNMGSSMKMESASSDSLSFNPTPMDTASASAMSGSAVQQAMLARSQMQGMDPSQIASASGTMMGMSSMIPFNMQSQMQQHMSLQQQQQHFQMSMEQGMQSPSSPMMFQGGSFMQGNFMNFQPPQSLEHRMQVLSQNPTSRMAAMVGSTIDEYQQQTQSLPMMFGGRFADALSPDRMGNTGFSLDSSMQPQAQQVQPQPSPSSSISHPLSLERRNTWSGLSQAQQHQFVQQQRAMQQYESDMADQLQQKRRTTIDFAQGQDSAYPVTSSSTAQSFGGARSASTSAIEGSARRRQDDSAQSRGYGRHRLGLDDMTPEMVTNTAPDRFAAYQQQRSSSSSQREKLAPSAGGRYYPDDWFQADSKMPDSDHQADGKGGDGDEEPIRYSPDGDLNQKLSSSLHSSSSGSPPSPGMPFKKNKSTKGASSDKKSRQDKSSTTRKVAQPSDIKKHVGATTSLDSGEPLSLEASQQSSLRTLGMQLDDESMDFLSNLRFGMGSEHSGSSRESDQN